jgi:hypothetical protein
MFNRLKSDGCSTQTALSDNVSIFSHAMDVHRFVHGESCRGEQGVVGANDVSTITAYPRPDGGEVQTARGAMVTLENDLRGATRPLTSCPLYGYQPQAGVISSTELYKPVTHPVIRTDRMSDLPSCRLIDYQQRVPRNAGR